jgi:hypothetical protein
MKVPPSRRRTLEASHTVFILRESVRQNLDRDVAIELGVGGTALGFQQNKIRIPDIPNRPALLAELMAFEAVPLQNGLTRFSAPPGAAMTIL